jgi:hypothetical protein
VTFLVVIHVRTQICMLKPLAEKKMNIYVRPRSVSPYVDYRFQEVPNNTGKYHDKGLGSVDRPCGRSSVDVRSGGLPIRGVRTGITPPGRGVPSSTPRSGLRVPV